MPPKDGAILKYAVKLIGDPEITSETLLKSCTEGGDQTDSASKIEKKETELKKMTKKLSASKLKKDEIKDDSELLKNRREKTKTELEPILPKRSKDDLDLLSAAKKLQNVNVKKLKGDEIYKCIEDLKDFLKIATTELKDSSFVNPIKDIVQSLNKVPKNIDLAKVLADEETVKKIFYAQKKIEEEVIKMGGI
ncbi:MAG: hypothetical protein LBK29_03795 [Oscillospiraceae bacterium]|jgi:hypothetical protein|nr:hypothetical protein [Oscillospiraceae bacterium]